jgi:hypothetical protein
MASLTVAADYFSLQIEVDERQSAFKRINGVRHRIRASQRPSAPVPDERAKPSTAAAAIFVKP